MEAPARNAPMTGPGDAPAPPALLLSTKLTPPRLRADALVTRPAVSLLLDQALRSSLTIVVAPPGYGKTTALADWYGRIDRDVCDAAWLTLDETDDDPAHAMHHLLGSFARNAPELRALMPRVPEHRLDVDPQAFAIALLRAIEQRGRALVLVIDDLHAIDNAQIIAMFGTLAVRGGGLLHLVLGSRTDPDIRLSRLRTLGELTEIRADAFAFLPDEVRRLFPLADFPDLDDATIDDLVRRTEGWIAGIKLAILAQPHPGSGATLPRVGGAGAGIADFLREEVLSGLPDTLARFVVEAAVIGEFSAALCDHAMERTDSAARIADLERRQLFLASVGEPGWYRFHQLFADAAAAPLLAEEPDRPVHLHERASEWFAARGFPSRALRHAFATGDPDIGARMLDRVAQRLVQSGRGITLDRYARMLPQELLGEYPDVQLEQIYSLTLTWQFSEARRILRDVRSQLMNPARIARWRDRGLDVDRVQRKLIYDEMQLAVLQDEAPQAGTLARQWQAMDGAYSPFEDAVTQTSLLYAEREQFQLGNLAASGRAREIFVAEGNRWGTVWHDCIIGAGYAQRGDLDRARAIFEGAFDTGVEIGGRSTPTAAMPALHLAEIAYEQGETDAAAVLIDEFLPLATQTGLVDQLVAAYQTQARIAAGRSPQAALDVLDKGEELSIVRGFDRLHAFLIADRIRMLAGAGEAAEVRRIGMLHNLTIDLDELAPGRGATSAAAARAFAAGHVALIENRLVDAERLLRRWLKFLEERGCARFAIRFAMLLGHIQMVMGEEKAAHRTLRTALQLGIKGRFLRSFTDANPAVRNQLPLMRFSVAGDGALAEFHAALVERLAAEAGAAPNPVAAAPVPIAGPYEALNDRESEILLMIATGMMNSEIADEAGLTLGTVKWYLQQIYGKLGVKRRSEAVFRARQLGLIA
jgi:LuxR family maltose regulon positive regulatory protein